MKLALGTVQFGLRYGVANTTGQVPLADVRSILAAAQAAGMNCLDTAAAYGDSEMRLGEAGVADWQVVTKLPALPDGCEDVKSWATSSVASSRRLLRADKLHGVLLHRSSDLKGSGGVAIYKSLRKLQEAGSVVNIGVSIYDPDELSGLIPEFELQLVQAPYNVVDRRLADSGWLERLKERGIEVHSRSAFLQGLLLMNRSNRPAHFERWSGLWATWENWLTESRLTALEGALGFALMCPPIDRVVVGVDTLSQLKEIVAASQRQVSSPPVSLACVDADLLNPSRWNVP